MNADPQSIVRFRKRHNWSQDELATASGLNLRTIQRIENEGIASLASMKALSAALQVKVEDIQRGDDRAKRFEYKTAVLPFKSGIFKVGAPDIQTALNRECEQGWRFSQMAISTNNSGGSDTIIAVFERAVTPPR